MASELYDAYVEREILPKMQLRCAWHPKFFGLELVMRQAAEGHEQDPPSDGICKACLELLKKEASAA